MTSENLPDNTEKSTRFIPIPDILYADQGTGPMQYCVMCNKDLLHAKEPYIIEKAFRFYPEFQLRNTIFEYIMCMGCAKKMHDSMSEESIRNIRNYFSKIDLQDRSAKLWSADKNNFEAWTSQCLVKGTEKKNLNEYQICAQCIGDQLVFDLLPYMLSFEASEEVSSLLSAKTLGEYNRFIDDYFGLPPEFKKALKEKPVLFG